MTPIISTKRFARICISISSRWGELLFVEYKCPIEQDAAGVWTFFLDCCDIKV